MKQAVEELARLFEQIFARAASGAQQQTHLLAGADDEIDRLFQ